MTRGISFDRERYAQVKLTPGSVSGNTTAEQTFTITNLGFSPASFVTVNKPSFQAGLGIVNTRISALDTLAITYVNATSSPITPTAESYYLHVVRPDVIETDGSVRIR